MAISPAPSCQDVLNQCRIVIDAADLSIRKQADTISALDAQNTRLMSALDDANAKAAQGEAWYKQPGFTVPVALVLGILVGAYAGRK